MPKKRGNIENSAFFGKVLDSSKNATKEVSRVLASGDPGDGTKKKIEHIDIRLMEDAPEGWNLYPRLKDSQLDRYLELKMSIHQKGVQDPIILWKRAGEKYMILAGHNRRSICEDILEECRDERGFNEELYRRPPCIVYREDELTEEGAREIIDDTNLYRDFSKLPNKVKIQITRHRMEVYKQRRYAKGERIDQLAKELGLEKSAVYENLAIAEKVIPQLQEMYYSEKLTRKAVARFTFFDKDTQEWILAEYGDMINDARTKALKKNMSRQEIARVFSSEDKGIKKVTVEVPVGRVEEFREMFAKWLGQQ